MEIGVTALVKKREMCANQGKQMISGPREWNIGDVIMDLYEVTAVLGQGGMGKVYKVHHRNWNMDLALKSPLAELFKSKGAVKNFTREAETWVSLGAPSACGQLLLRAHH